MKVIVYVRPVCGGVETGNEFDAGKLHIHEHTDENMKRHTIILRMAEKDA